MKNIISSGFFNLLASSFCFLYFSNSAYTQTITSVEVNHTLDPIEVHIQGQAMAGYTSRIVVTSSGDEMNTQIIEVYIKHCYPQSIIYYFNELVLLDTENPFDLCVYTYYDSTQISTEDPVCAIVNPDVIPGDTLCLNAGQILSSSDFRQSLKQISVYPIPTEDFVKIDVPAELTVLKFTLADLSGRVISAHRHSEKQIDVRAILAGVYLLRIETDQGTTTRKIIRR